ncbi:MAG TPA: porin [Gemmata sp.]|nr:porin [Gemmata sp.]
MRTRGSLGIIARLGVTLVLLVVSGLPAIAQDWHSAQFRIIPNLPAPSAAPVLEQTQRDVACPAAFYSTVDSYSLFDLLDSLRTQPFSSLPLLPPEPTMGQSPDLPITPIVQSTPGPSLLPPSDGGTGLPYGRMGTTPGEGTQAPFFGWDNGFYLRSADQQFILRVTGQLQADFRGYLDDNAPRDVTEFLIRRARFGLEATVFQYYEFRFLPDFGVGQVRLQDAYINVHYVDWIQFTAGKFKQPFSYEQLIQDRFTPLMERSLIDQLTPQRDVGVMVHGQNLFAGILDYGLAVSNGEQNGDSDTNSSKDLNGRIAVRPFADSDTFLKRLMFGVAAGFGVETESMNPSTLQTPAGVPFLQFKSTAYANGLRDRLSPEIAYFYGPFGISSQYFQMEQKIQEKPGASLPIRVPFEGFYVHSTYLLTGETRTGYSQQIKPLQPYDPRQGLNALGAWELVGRLSRLQVGADAFAPGNTQLVTPAGNSSGATEMTLGYNWYLNSWVRVQFNYEHAWFDQPVRLGAGPEGLHSHTDTITTRLQFVF